MLIAHRGDKTRQPENTIAAFESAHGLGACAIFTDIQFSADGTPWCYHGKRLPSLEDGEQRPLYRLRDRDLRQLPINSFAQVADWASCHRHLDWFLEVDSATLERTGVEEALGALLSLMGRTCDAFALLNRDFRTLRLARNMGWHRTALKVESVARCLSAEMLTLAPDYLLISEEHVECRELPPGPWQWVVYEVNSAEEAVHWRRRGAHHILTGNMPLLMGSREASDVYGF